MLATRQGRTRCHAVPWEGLPRSCVCPQAGGPWPHPAHHSLQRGPRRPSGALPSHGGGEWPGRRPLGPTSPDPGKVPQSHLLPGPAWAEGGGSGHIPWAPNSCSSSARCPRGTPNSRKLGRKKEVGEGRTRGWAQAPRAGGACFRGVWSHRPSLASSEPTHCLLWGLPPLQAQHTAGV